MPLGSTSFRCYWPSTAAGIPAGWSRDTNFDARYCQGDTSSYTGPVNGGSTTTGHTGTAHTPLGNAHTHTIDSDSVSPSSIDYTDPGLTATVIAAPTHSHAQVNSASATETYGSANPAITSVDTRPLSKKLIVIVPNDVNQDVPDGAVVFTDKTSAMSGYRLCDGTAGAPDLRDRYILGADAGGDASLSDAGAATHTHPVANHLHSVNAHGHASTLTGIASATRNWTDSFSTPPDTMLSQHHPIQLTSTTSAANTSTQTGVNTTSASNDPAYIYLGVQQNNSGGQSTPEQTILPFVDVLANLPAGWELCDGTNGTLDCRNRQVKATTAGGTIGTTGGANTHTHTWTCTVTSTSHNHPASLRSEMPYKKNKPDGMAGGYLCVDYASHTSVQHTWTIGSTVPTIQNVTATMSTDDVRYSYRTVLWVRKKISAARIVSLGGAVSRSKIVLVG